MDAKEFLKKRSAEIFADEKLSKNGVILTDIMEDYHQYKMKQILK